MVSFNFGLSDINRLKQCVKYGIINSVIVSAVITVLFQLFSSPISSLFAMSLPDVTADGILKTDILSVTKNAVHIASIGYVFMGVSVAVQGILQGLRSVYKPIAISALRLIVFVIPFAVMFCLRDSVSTSLWWTFVISEVLTSICALALLYGSVKKAGKALNGTNMKK